MPQIIGYTGGHWRFLGDSTGETIRYIGGVLDTEAVGLKCVRAEVTHPRKELEKVSRDYETLYQWEYPPPPDRHVPTHVIHSTLMMKHQLR